MPSIAEGAAQSVQIERVPVSGVKRLSADVLPPSLVAMVLLLAHDPLSNNPFISLTSLAPVQYRTLPCGSSPPTKRAQLPPVATHGVSHFRRGASVGRSQMRVELFHSLLPGIRHEFPGFKAVLRLSQTSRQSRLGFRVLCGGAVGYPAVRRVGTRGNASYDFGKSAWHHMRPPWVLLVHREPTTCLFL